MADICDGSMERVQRARTVRRGLLGFAFFFLLLAGAISVGGLHWPWGWTFLAIYFVSMLAATAYLWRTNPEVIVARSSMHWRDQTAWQNVIVVAVCLLFVAIFEVAAMDNRYRWSAVPLVLVLAGYVLFAIGMAGTVWVLRVNKFAEPAARIQAERGQTVIDSGPYAIARHPLYSASFFLCVGIPLALGSYWALGPAAIAYLILVVRTAMEDRMLHNELAGYQEYAARVRYRLLPGVW